MQLSQLTHGLNTELLLEANILNVKDLYNDVSVVAYANKYAKAVGNKALATAFVSKFSKFMLNDERWHMAVRQLPPNSPEWAHTAFDKRELVYFQPNAELNDRMEHIMHYLEAIGADGEQANDDNDVKVFAQREMQALPKLQTFDLLVQKSNEYFKRGSKKVRSEIEGMKEIYDTKNGFIWYLMTDAEAFKTEGKVMQNCLGSFWTLAKCKTQGQSVVIMKKTNGESLVAARINNESNEILEMKGKNNKPPIDKYMGGVLDFIRGRKLTVGSNAKNDFENAGYFYIDDKLHTRAEALEKFVTVTDIANIGTKKLVKVNIHKDVVKLVNQAYKGFGNEFSQYRWQGKEIYELRDGSGHAVISALVEDKNLIALHRSKRQAEVNVVLESVDTTSNVGRLLIRELYERGIVDQLNDNIHGDLFWNDRLKVHENGEIKPTTHETTRSKKGGFNWEHHDDEEQKHYIRRQLTKGAGYRNDNDGIATLKPDNVKSAFLHKMSDGERESENASHFAAISTHTGHKTSSTGYNGHFGTEDGGSQIHPSARGQLIPAKMDINNSGRDTVSKHVSHQKIMNPKEAHSTGKKHDRAVTSYIELANDRDLDFPQNFKYNNGIITDADGKHRVYDDKPQKLTDEPPGLKFDLSKYSKTDKATIINHLATSAKLNPIERTDDTRGHNTRVNSLLHQPGIHKGFRSRDRQRTTLQEWTNNDSATTPLSKIEQRYRGGVLPDAIYVAQVVYGSEKKHTVIMSATGNEITQIDGFTRNHDLQHWGDHEKIADQLNKVLDAGNLTIKKGILNKADAKELRIKHGNPRRFTSAAGVAEGRIGKLMDSGAGGLEGTDTLPFADGGKIVRMDPSDQAAWLRQSLKSYKVPGVGWQITNKKDEPVGIVFIKNGQIMSAFHHNPDEEGEKDYTAQRENREGRAAGTVPGVSMDMLPDVQAAMKAFGWTLSTKALKHARDLDSDSRIQFRRFANGQDMKLNRNTDSGSYAKSWQRRGLAKRVKTEKIKAKYTNTAVMHTYDTWKMTQKGQDYLEDIRSSNWISDDPTRHGNPSKLQDGFVVPPMKEKERKQRTPVEPGMARPVSTTTRSGTKSEQAMNLFRQHVEDNDEIPSRRDFMALLQAEPFNMSKAGASTYYANTKKKYSALNEKYSVLAALELMVEQHLFLEDWI